MRLAELFDLRRRAIHIWSFKLSVFAFRNCFVLFSAEEYGVFDLRFKGRVKIKFAGLIHSLGWGEKDYVETFLVSKTLMVNYYKQK